MRKLITPVVNWREIPFIRLTLPLIFGIFLGEKFAIGFNWMLFIFCSLIVSSFLIQQSIRNYAHRWIAGILLNLFFGFLGVLLLYAHQEINDNIHFRHHILEENYLVGVVNSSPEKKAEKIRLQIDIKAIGGYNTPSKNGTGSLLVYLEDTENNRSVQYGDLLKIRGKILPIPSSRNPHAFDYKKYLYYKNIHYQTFIKNKQWQILKARQGSPIMQVILDWRQQLLQILELHIPQKEELAIASALLLGYKSELTAELKSAYSESGAVHVLAVSGLHVGIISTFLLFILNRIFPSFSYWKWVKLSIIIVFIWLFALLSGFSPSVQRAAMMFSILHLGKTLQRDVSIYNALGIAAFFILIGDPYALFDVGFQFSFLAVFGIVFFTPKIIRWWSPNNSLGFWVWKIIVVGVSAQLMVFPLSLYYFHQMPVYFWLTGIFVIPFAALILKLGIALFLCSYVSNFLAGFLGDALYSIIAFQNQLIEWIRALPFHVLEGIWLDRIDVVIFYIVILGLALVLFTNHLKWIRLSLAALLLVACLRVAKTLEQLQQRKIIVYSLHGNGAIDFVDGNTLYSLIADKTRATPQMIDYNIQNNRLSVGVNRVIDLKEPILRGKNFYQRSNYIQFFKKKIAFYNQGFRGEAIHSFPFECDILVVQNNQVIDIEKLSHFFRFKEIILDGTNSNRTVDYWKKACREKNIPFKDVKNNGAYMIEL